MVTAPDGAAVADASGAGHFGPNPPPTPTSPTLATGPSGGADAAFDPVRARLPGRSNAPSQSVNTVISSLASAMGSASESPQSSIHSEFHREAPQCPDGQGPQFLGYVDSCCVAEVLRPVSSGRGQDLRASVTRRPRRRPAPPHRHRCRGNPIRCPRSNVRVMKPNRSAISVSSKRAAQSAAPSLSKIPLPHAPIAVSAYRRRESVEPTDPESYR